MILSQANLAESIFNRRAGDVARESGVGERFTQTQERLEEQARLTAGFRQKQLDIARERNRLAAEGKARAKTDLLIDPEGNLVRWPQGTAIPAGYQKAPTTTTELAQGREERLGERAEFATSEDVAKNIAIVEKNIDDPAAAGYMEVINRSRPDADEFYIQTQAEPVKIPEDVPLIGGKEVFQSAPKGKKVQLPKGVTSSDIYTTAEKNGLTPEQVLRQLGVLE